MSDECVLGLYSKASSVAEGIDALRQAGFTDKNIEILTDTPYPEGAFGESPTRQRFFTFPLVGAICGIAGGLLLTLGTQIAYPLPTGGKPILAIPPTLIITFEGMMLGAIIMTVVGMIFEWRLPRVTPMLYDRRISEGYIGLNVCTDETSLNKASDILWKSGADEVIQSLQTAREERLVEEEKVGKSGPRAPVENVPQRKSANARLLGGLVIGAVALAGLIAAVPRIARFLSRRQDRK